MFWGIPSVFVFVDFVYLDKIYREKLVFPDIENRYDNHYNDFIVTARHFHSGVRLAAVSGPCAGACYIAA